MLPPICSNNKQDPTKYHWQSYMSTTEMNIFGQIHSNAITVNHAWPSKSKKKKKRKK